MLATLRQRNFALLWTGGLISTIGDWILRVALPFYVYQRTGSTLATGAMYIAQILPGLFLSSLAGVLVDRWNRQWTMIVADLSRALLLLLLLSVRSAEWLWVIYLVAFVESAITQFFEPAKSALLPHLVSDSHLMKANSLNAFSLALTFLIGPSLGGVLMALVGLTIVILLDTASYLISGVLIAFISLPSSSIVRQTQTAHCALATWKLLWQEWLKGISLVKRERFLSILFLVMATAIFAQGIVVVLFVVFVKQVLHAGAAEFGSLVAIQGVGGLVSSFIVGQVSKVVPPTRLITVSEGTVGLMFLAMFTFPSLPLALTLSALTAVPATGYSVSTQTLLQTSVVDQYRGRVFGMLGTLNALMMLGGMGLASSLGDRLGVVPTLNIAGILYLFAGALAILLHRNRYVNERRS